MCAATLAWLVSLAPAAGAQAPATTIQPVAGFTIEREIAAGAKDRYELALTASQFADLVVADSSDVLTVTLTDEAGEERGGIARPAPSGSSIRVCAVAGRSGVSVVTVSAPADAGSRVRYSLQVVDIRPASDIDRTRAAALVAFHEGQQVYAERSADAYRRAITNYRTSADLWTTSGDRSEEAQVLHRLALVYAQTMSFPDALEADRRAGALWRELGERRAEAATVSSIGTTHVRAMNYPVALQYFERALPLFRATTDREGEAYTLASIGVLCQTIGDPARALEYYPQAMALWSALGDREGIALGLHDTGTAQRLAGNFPQALEELTNALRLRRALGNRVGAAAALAQIGHTHLALGNIDQAFASYEEALALQRTAGEWRGDGFAAGGGGAVADRGDWPAVMTMFSLGAAILRPSGDRAFEARLLHYTGHMTPKPVDVRRAIDLLTRARRVFHALSNRHWVAVMDTAIAAGYGAIGETDRALQGFADALPVFRAMRDRIGEAMALVGLAQVERRIGRAADALGHVEAAIALVEARRADTSDAELKALYGSISRDAYELYIALEMTLDAGDPGRGHQAAALAASERARARGLVDLLAEAKLDISEGVDPQLLQQERDVEARIRLADDRLTRLLSEPAKPPTILPAEHDVDDLIAELRAVRRQLKAGSPQYAALTQPVPLDLQDIQRLLDGDTVLLEYALGREQSYVWAITRDSLTAAVLPGRQQIDNAARRSYALLSAGSRRVTQVQTRRSLEALADLVLAPIRPALSARRLVIVADGALQYVPFAALPRPTVGTHTSAARDPLITRHEVVMLPSASALEALRQVERPRGRAAGTLAVFADPVLRPDDPRVKAGSPGSPTPRSAASDALRRAADEAGVGSLDRLPFTRAEANALTALAGSAHTLEALDFDASREAAIAGQARYRIVHFATHALINSRRPELSGIILSLVDRDGHPTDGFLRLHDIYNLSLNADLVVLSACRTALGKDIRGEGLVGLTRGFLYAGAPAVVASLWDVRDRSTAELMTRFYRGMLREHLTPAAALRAAQTSMWRDPRWSAPAHWAGFVLQGDWRSTR